ncbi:MAG: NAD(P)H-flavin reductase [Tatlockia sp.]|jgi:CDP-4-dehydro-6-deoxyglucose reductase
MSRTITAEIERIAPLTDRILQLTLAPEHYIDYQAGQYLDILLGRYAFSYSIANAPLGAHKYELHLRHSPENPANQQLLAEIKKRGKLTIQLPLGDCHLNQLDRLKPIVFIAGGTGFAPIHAMIEQLLANGDPRPFELFWGARSQSDLYLNEKVLQWQVHVAHFRYVSLLSTHSKETLASRVLAQHANDLKKWQFVIGGPFDMVFAIRDALIANGVEQGQLFSDAFSFEGR